MIRRPPRSTRVRSSAASDVYKRQGGPLPGARVPWRQSAIRGSGAGRLDLVTGRDRLCRRGVRTRRRHEDRLPVVAKLGDALANVGQGPVAAFLLGGGEESPREPPQGQLLDRGDIDDPVSYTHLRAHETVLDLVCRLLLEKKK